LESPIEEVGGFRSSAVQIQTIGTGDVLGWSWLFPPYYWHFDARAITPVKAIFFYGTALREEGERDNDFGLDRRVGRQRGGMLDLLRFAGKL